MSSNNNGHKPLADPHHHSVFGSASGSGVVWAQITLKSLDEEMAKLKAMDSHNRVLATGARLALAWIRDGNLPPSEVLKAVT